MITEIGIVAGDIWHYLDSKNGEANFSSLKSGVDQPKDLLLMSLGWLSREGYVVLEQLQGDDYKITLRK
ncbi:MAG: hypothetical protein COW11_04845 [Candidatus Omnitrophica bacterium CG12_big_fil_rev_8_21_14_0_65_43_15]|uniref:Winged helix-turn-helix domain-containing protein n=1 Tax=Candidatus Taenaricola geysiri TaxID=1974752 RepID=A0A2J0LQT2_9BACT|nr:MAG: hypothetical protein AUJ89_04790 [Candidatus Omnitrophica bacterium CG1_02_43_210]PIR65544.1 MAG: hypothetical protein COU52_03670 [Candidatus Omnitrophica bacterium CG10_big_fil_rev_8_21_14_0_10_43_8]PIV12538.1 MAG: hypothetical protein COS48_00425 [Candidatus Omnitrophica bacterium CG03_land_8_20_14_0_80_43_22]PIW66197.1 MAG: hypothetical protein COW11_04845 [Candidatus Omnitrophica bacterium CG12_big_fil_rev_8_21_14_0_65_43_15]PIW80255.1 MAG: hypothetical protein COZ98_03340 [Candida